MSEEKDKSLIHVLDKRVALHQIEGGFRTSMDSVMLAAACPVKAGQSVLDLGCGVGSVGLCIIEREPKASLMGVDIQGDHVEMAKKNAALNGVSGQAEFICADVATLEMESFDHVVCNPPYLDGGAHIPSPSLAKAQAMGHVTDGSDLSLWITCAFRHIKGQGSLSLIHSAGETDDILHALYGRGGGRRFGAVEIIPLWPHTGQAAKRVIIRAWKHKKSQSVIHAGIVMHEADGTYTESANAILRNMEKIY